MGRRKARNVWNDDEQPAVIAHARCHRNPHPLQQRHYPPPMKREDHRRAEENDDTGQEAEQDTLSDIGGLCRQVAIGAMVDRYLHAGASPGDPSRGPTSLMPNPTYLCRSIL